MEPSSRSGLVPLAESARSQKPAPAARMRSVYSSRGARAVIRHPRDMSARIKGMRKLNMYQDVLAQTMM